MKLKVEPLQFISKVLLKEKQLRQKYKLLLTVMKLPNKVHFVLMNHLVGPLTHKMSKLSKGK